MRFVHISRNYLSPTYNVESALYLPLNATQYIKDDPDKHRDLFVVHSPDIEATLPVGFPLTKSVEVVNVPAQVTLPPHCHLCRILDGCKGEDDYCSLEHGWCDMCHPQLPPGFRFLDYVQSMSPHPEDGQLDGV